MIKAGAATLPRPVRANLASWQGEVNAARTFPLRVKAADREFDRRRASAPFRPVLNALRAMCSGPQRCMYCEDNCGDEVEHFRPKSLYPELVFAWENFLFACTRCNRRKSVRFPVFSRRVHSLVEIQPAQGGRRPPGLTGAPVLLDPRVDDPEDFLRLEMRDTFLFVPLGVEGTRAHQRARRTIEVLGLNERAELPRVRKTTYRNVLNHLHRAASLGGTPAGDQELERIREAIAHQPCSIVWRQMRRYREAFDEVRAAFQAVPAALNW